MKLTIPFNNTNYIVDLNTPLDISIPLGEGNENPNCYWSDSVIFETIRSGNFVGSIKDGGFVNHKKLTITPHGNGTHTETYAHIHDAPEATIANLTNIHHSIAELVSITPEKQKNGDFFIGFDAFLKERKYNTPAIIIRTLPNTKEKIFKNYSGTNPPYLDPKIAAYAFQHDIKHLLIDLPSIDKEVDEGKLLAHHAFWGNESTIRRDAFITELIFVNNQIEDGLYLINLHTLNIKLDVSPSRPVIYKLQYA